MSSDPSARLEMSKPTVPLPKSRQKGTRYTPISKRQDRPDAIAWLLRSHPELSDAQISRLIGTTKPTITAVREKTHRNISSITPQSPIYLGLCSASELEKMVMIARTRVGKPQYWSWRKLQGRTQCRQNFLQKPRRNTSQDS